jgi:hypothetical protein
LVTTFLEAGAEAWFCAFDGQQDVEMLEDEHAVKGVGGRAAGEVAQ